MYLSTGARRISGCHQYFMGLLREIGGSKGDRGIQGESGDPRGEGNWET